MANGIDWEYIFPAVKNAFESGCKFQMEAIMNNNLKPRPKLPGVDLTPAA
ncbi:hypothetical protein [Microvirga soli]|jgi:hypothetical protein|nr:hypothetical protein [Microvirga soli]